MRNLFKKHTVQQGFTIVEIMVALVLSLFLIGGVIQVYISNKVTYRMTESLSRTQESGRFAIEMLGYDIRMADFWGCAAQTSAANVNNMLDPDGTGYNAAVHDVANLMADGITGTDGGTGAADPDSGSIYLSDTLTLRGIFNNGTMTTKIPNTTAAALQVSQGSGLAIGDIVIVSDCEKADVFQITNKNTSSGKDNIVHNTGAQDPGNVTQDLSKLYGQDAQILKYASFTYSIGAGFTGEPALMRSQDGAAAEEIVSGVENMQILYGEDINTDGAADRYVAAAGVVNMGNVVSIRISLLLRSLDNNVVETPQAYTYGGTATTAVDRRYRQVFTSTITIRNRII